MTKNRESLHRAETQRHIDRLRRMISEKPFLPRADRQALAFAAAMLEETLKTHDKESLH